MYFLKRTQSLMPRATPYAQDQQRLILQPAELSLSQKRIPTPYTAVLRQSCHQQCTPSPTAPNVNHVQFYSLNFNNSPSGSPKPCEVCPVIIFILHRRKLRSQDLQGYTCKVLGPGKQRAKIPEGPLLLVSATTSQPSGTSVGRLGIAQPHPCSLGLQKDSS